MSDARRYLQAAQHLDGTLRAVEDAERSLQHEHQQLANSGQLFPVKSVELGHEETRYVGDINATFAPFSAGATWRGKLIPPPRGGGRR